MTVGIPSAETLATFVANSSTKRIEEIVARVTDTMRADFAMVEDPWHTESAIELLKRAWDARSEWWEATFPDDEAFKWLTSQEAIDRCWNKATSTKKLRHLNLPSSADNAAKATEIVDGMLREWAGRVIAKGRLSRNDFPLLGGRVERWAVSVHTQWKWLHGIAGALHDYLHVDKAAALINERKTIRAMHAEAIKGWVAFEAFAATHFWEQLRRESNSFWHVRTYGRKEQPRLALEILGEVPIEDFYPSIRNDATAGERLLVASLADLHCELFRVPKPDAISELMNASFIKNPLDLRTIERICSDRRTSRGSLTRALDDARVQYYDRIGLKSRQLSP